MLRNIIGEKMEDQIKNTEETSQEKKEREIDLIGLFTKLWVNKKIILMWCMWGVLAGLIIAFSIPREYSTSVKLAPEARSRTSLSGGLGALASMAGITTSSNTTTDAVYPQLYPDIVGSVPFLMSLMDVKVKDKDDKEYTVEEYLLEKTKRPWWTIITGLPRKAIGLFQDKSPEETFVPTDTTRLIISHDVFKLTKKDDIFVGLLKSRVTANVDQKTNVITIKAEMQDPVISALLADTVVSRLREFVTDYRTSKARVDLDYAQKLNDEAQEEYYKAQQRLADYNDRNQNLATQSARVTRERLENESSLAFNLYNQTSLQVQTAKSRVQETTPVYTILTPATVPLRPTSPRRGLIIGGFTFLALICSCGWILFGDPMYKEYKKKLAVAKEAKASEESNEKETGKDS